VKIDSREGISPLKVRKYVFGRTKYQIIRAGIVTQIPKPNIKA